MTLVTVEQVATRLGLDATTLTPLQQAQVTAAIEDSQGKVSAYLARPLVPESVTVPDLYPMPGYPLTDYHCWPQVETRFNDRYDVTATAAAASGAMGLYDVTFSVGIDVAGDPEFAPILTFITQDAIASLRLNPAFTLAARPVTSVSADGQSVSYDKPNGSGNQRAGHFAPTDPAGAPMNLTVLNRWRRRAVYAQRTTPLTPWPYNTGYGSSYGY